MPLVVLSKIPLAVFQVIFIVISILILFVILLLVPFVMPCEISDVELLSKHEVSPI